MSKSLFLRLDGFTRADRIQMTASVSDAINQSGAWITDFHQYSNLLICINFQVSSQDVASLTTALQATGLKLSQESLDQLIAASRDSPSNDQDYIGTLQITFIHNDPDLIRDVPAVPG